MLIEILWCQFCWFSLIFRRNLRCWFCSESICIVCCSDYLGWNLVIWVCWIRSLRSIILLDIWLVFCCLDLNWSSVNSAIKRLFGHRLEFWGCLGLLWFIHSSLIVVGVNWVVVSLLMCCLDQVSCCLIAWIWVDRSLGSYLPWWTLLRALLCAELY